MTSTAGNPASGAARRRIRGLFGAPAGIAVTLQLLLSAAPARGQDLTDPTLAVADAGSAEAVQEILVDLRIGRLASRTIRAFTNGPEALLPVTGFLGLAEVEFTLDSLEVLRARVYPENRRVVVTPDPVAASVNGDRIPVDPEDVLRADGELYVATSVLETLFDLVVLTDWVELAVTVMTPDALPLGQRLAREARWRTLQGARSVGVPPLLDLTPPRLGGSVLDWGVSSNARDVGETTAYSLGFGARAFDGGLRISSRSEGPIADGRHRFDATYQAVFQGRSWITQMRVGDAFTTGPRLREVRGISLTNAPFLRRSFFGTDGFSGRVGPGWEIELRQQGRTLDLARADEEGAFALDIPLQYGENSLQVLAFGPHGEVVTSDRIVLLGYDRLPDGRFEWGLSGGKCRTVRCSTTGNLDLRYGLTDRWTVRAGAEGFTRDTLASVLQPYLGITGSLSQSLHLSVEGVREGFLRTGMTFAPSPWIRTRLAYTAFSTDLAEPVLHSGLRRNTTEADAFLRPLKRNPRFFLRASGLRQELEAGTVANYQAALNIPHGNLNIEPGIRRQVDEIGGAPASHHDFQFATATGLVRVAGRQMWIRGEAEFLEGREWNRRRLAFGYQLGSTSRLEVAGAWQQVVGSTLTISFTAYLSQMRSITQVSAGENAPAQFTQFSQGTVHWNEATRRATLAPGPGADRGGISGYVFLDRNGDGWRDPGEEGIEGVRLVVGSQTVTTDEEGRHSAWDLVPFEPVRIWADSASIADPTLVPTYSHVQVTVPPASFGRVDVPVLYSRELVGRVVMGEDGSERLVPYAPLVMVDMRTGETRRFGTFSDGEFYEAAVRPGRYRLRLERSFAETNGLVVEGGWVEFEVPADESSGLVGPIELRLVPRSTR